MHSQASRGHRFVAGILCSLPGLCTAAAVSDLARLSLADLANIEVTSVSKAGEALQSAPASVFVITHDDIVHSGATSVPEALRLAPNLLVSQTSASAFVISARGLGGNSSAQNFSNKLLILIDGRSVYSPLFSGIYSDTLDVLLEDVDRIEVISGVGATLWGANAMNGVINIITRPAYLTQGALLDAGGGNQLQSAAARFGGMASADVSVRAYAQAFHRGALQLADGASAQDGWSKGQAGFRGDWTTERDTVTWQGDLYRATERLPDSPDGSIAGANLVARYQHHADRSDLQVQAYADQTERFAAAGGGGFVVHTYDLELQQSIALGAAHRLVWGGGERVTRYGITNTATLLFEPPQHALTLANVFVQDTASPADALDVVFGIKLEDDPFSGWTALPDVRIGWTIDPQATLWAAASRGIRSPTPFDDEVVEKVAATTFLAANTRFRPERVDTFEVGSRVQPSASVALSFNPFYNVYDDLRTIEPGPATAPLPLYWGNLMRGHTEGVDAWADWQVSDWWRLSPGITWVRERLRFKTAASRLLGIAQAADDPSSHATLKSSMILTGRLRLDASLRYVGALPEPALPHYTECDARLS
jgi:iron complex outermembrane receptor protein